MNESQRRHHERFSKVSNRYPRCVIEAYAGDFGRAMAASDEQVAVTVAFWESQRGIAVRDWPAVGAREKGRETG